MKLEAKHFIITLPIVWLLLVLAIPPLDAEAFCVYNKSKYDLHVRGNECKFAQFDVTIPKGQRRCCPGDNRCCGEQDISVIAENHKGEMVEVITPEEVPAHGWVVLTSGASQVKDPSYLLCKVVHPDKGVLYNGLMGATSGVW